MMGGMSPNPSPALSPCVIADRADMANAMPRNAARGSAEVVKYRTRQGEIRDEFKVNLAAAFLPTMPQAVTEEVFRLAWDQGHAHGYGQVEESYMEYADLVNLVEQAVRLG